MQLERVPTVCKWAVPKPLGDTLLISRVGHLLARCAGQHREKVKGHVATGNEGIGKWECGKEKERVSELGWTEEEEVDDGSGLKWSMWRERPPVGSLLEIYICAAICVMAEINWSTRDL